MFPNGSETYFSERFRNIFVLMVWKRQIRAVISGHLIPNCFQTYPSEYLETHSSRWCRTILWYWNRLQHLYIKDPSGRQTGLKHPTLRQHCAPMVSNTKIPAKIGRQLGPNGTPTVPNCTTTSFLALDGFLTKKSVENSPVLEHNWRLNR